MKRANFIQIIKLRSVWKIDRRKGDYKLPNGERLSFYITSLVESQMKLDKLGIAQNGDLHFCCLGGGDWICEKKEFNDYVLLPDFKEEKEVCTAEEMDGRIKHLVWEIVGLA